MGANEETAVRPAPVLGRAQRLSILYIMAASIFMQTFDQSVLNTALPAIAADLGRTAMDTQILVISYALAVAAAMPISGYLSDRFGTRPVTLFSIALFGLGSIFSASAPTFETLLAARAIQGVGGAFLAPVSRLTMLKSFKKSEWLGVMNWVVTPGIIGPVVGPVVGGYFVQYLNWHWIFLLNLPLALLGLYFSWRFVPNYKDRCAKLDALSYALFVFFVFNMTLGVDLMGLPTNSSKGWSFLLIVTSVLSLALYFRRSGRVSNPLFPLSLFYIRTFRIGVVGNIVTRLGLSALPLLFPLYLQLAHGQSPIAAGSMLVSMTLTMVLVKPFTSVVINRFGYRNILIYNTVISGALILAFAIPIDSSNVLALVAPMMLLGVANSIQFTAMNTILLADLQPHQESSGNTLAAVNMQMSISFGLAFGAAIVRLLDSYDFLGGGRVDAAFRRGFFLLGVITILSAGVFARLRHDDGSALSRHRSSKGSAGDGGMPRAESAPCEAARGGARAMAAKGSETRDDGAQGPNAQGDEARASGDQGGGAQSAPPTGSEAQGAGARGGE